MLDKVVVPEPLRRPKKSDLASLPGLTGDSDTKWDQKEVIVEIYEQYLQAGTLPPSARKANGKDLKDLTFDEYLHECSQVLNDRIASLPKYALAYGLTQQEVSTNLTIARMTLDVISWFRRLLRQQQDSILNETKSTPVETRTPEEIASNIMRDVKRQEVADRKTYPLTLRQMKELLTEAHAKTRIEVAKP